MKKLNDRQKKFCELYCGECKGNAYQSAIKAGYSENYASGMSYKLLENEGIQQYIQELNKTVQSARIASIEEIQAYWTSVMRDEDQRQADRLQASIQLGKCKGMFAEW